MSLSTSTTYDAGWSRAIASGIIMGLILVGASVFAYTSPAGSPPSNNAVTPIYTNSSTTQTTTNLGIKRATTSAYDFAVEGRTQIWTGSLFSSQSIIIDNGVDHAFTLGAASILDIQGTLNATGPTGNNPGNIKDERMTSSNYPLSLNSSFTDSDPVCATQAGVLVRCTGCTDPSSVNYDPAAITDNGTCTLNVYHWEYGAWSACQQEAGTCQGTWTTQSTPYKADINGNPFNWSYFNWQGIANAQAAGANGLQYLWYPQYNNVYSTNPNGLCSSLGQSPTGLYVPDKDPSLLAAAPAGSSSSSSNTSGVSLQNGSGVGSGGAVNWYLAGYEQYNGTCMATSVIDTGVPAYKTDNVYNSCQASSPQTASACTGQSSSCTWSGGSLYSTSTATCHDMLGNLVSNSLCDIDELGTFGNNSNGDYTVSSALVCNGLTVGQVPTNPNAPSTGISGNTGGTVLNPNAGSTTGTTVGGTTINGNSGGLTNIGGTVGLPTSSTSSGN